MTFKVSYGNEPNKTLHLTVSSDKKVKDYKEDIARETSVQPEYIALKYIDQNLEDDRLMSDYGVGDSCEILMLLIATVINVRSSGCEPCSKYRQFFMDYDDRVGALRKKYCDKCGVKDVELNHDGVVGDEELLRRIKGDFIGYDLVSVTAVDEVGVRTSVEVFGSATVASLRGALPEKGHRVKVLMMGDDLLDDRSQLCTLEHQGDLIVHAGFDIPVSTRSLGEGLIGYIVNVDTKISRLQCLLGRRFRVAEWRMALMLGGVHLDAGRTVGEYGIEEGTVLDVAAGVRVTVVGEDGGEVTVDIHEGATVASLKNELLKKGRAATVLMKGNDRLDGRITVGKLSYEGALNVHAGFCVSICLRDIELLGCVVNVDTRISRLQQLVAEKLDLEEWRVALRLDGALLDAGRTVGEYGIRVGTVLSVVKRVEVTVVGLGELECAKYRLEEDRVFGYIKSRRHEGTVRLLWNGEEVDDTGTGDSVRCGGDIKLRLSDEESGVVITGGDRIWWLKKRFSDAKNTIYSTFNWSKGTSSAQEGNDGGSLAREEMHVNVVNNLACGGASVQLSMRESASIEDLRAAIAHHFSIGPCVFEIRHGNRLVSRGSLCSVGIENEDTVVVEPKKQGNVNQPLVIKVENITDDCEQNYLINEFETVGALKVVLQDQYNVSVDCIRLRFGGVERGDDEVIVEMGLDGGAVVTMAIEGRLREPREVSVRLRDDVGGAAVDGLLTYDNVTVEFLRCRIEKERGWCLEGKVLSLDGVIMKPQNVLSTYNIGDETEILVGHSLLIRTFVAGENACAKINRYPFTSRDSVADLKTRISRRLMIQPRFINLSFDGDLLQDDSTLKDVPIENESYLMMVTTLAGGG